MFKIDYLIRTNIYNVVDGIKNPAENAKMEHRIYEDIIADIEEKEGALKLKNDISDLLYETSKNYFCKGLKMGMEIGLTLFDQRKGFEDEEIEWIWKV